jgi:hypothetical protein
MPFRHAHWLLLLLAPIIGYAFWPDYFGRIGSAPFAFHAHGLTASAWLLLVAVQSWTIHARRRALHRAAGLAVFAAVPLFAGGAVLAVQSMAVKYATASHPFYAVFGPRLGMHDIISTTALVLMVRAALAHRRRMALHGGYMLATVLLVLPPIMARLPLHLPPPLHAGEVLAIALAALLYHRRPRDGRPFLFAGGVMALEVLAFETFGASAWWAGLFAGLAALPPVPLALLAVAVAGVALWFAWPTRPAPGRTAAPA